MGIVGFQRRNRQLRRRRIVAGGRISCNGSDARHERRFRIVGKGASACRGTRDSLANAVGAGAVRTGGGDYFTDSYFRGRTPAPCTRCNSRIKWPCLAAEADALGIRYIATGHYFRITSAGGKRYVTRAADNRKDQSYYLWDLPQEVLDRVLTPMGTVIKRNIVEELADRRESMGVCFLEGRPCRDFLRSRDKTEALRPGPIIDSAGHRLGTHDGAALYTIGQKKGLDLPPGWAVVAIDTAANRIVAGEEKLLLHRTLEVGECRLVESDEVFGARDIRAVIRGIGRNPEGYAAVFPAASGIRIELEDPAWAPAAGQPVVLYRGERVVGGGILERYY